MKTLLRFSRLYVALGGTLLGAAPALADELIAHVTITTPRYQLHPVANGIQRLELPADASVEWASAIGGEAFADGHLTLLLPVASGQRLHVEREALADGQMKLTVLLRVAAVVVITSDTTASTASPAATATPASRFTTETPVATLLTALKVSPEVASALADGVNFDPAAKADFAIPSSPAASILQSDAEILSPTTPRETVTTILSNFDEDGQLKAGFSIAVTPYTVFRKDTISLREYAEEDNWHVRFFTRLQVSVAAKASDSQDPAATESPTDYGIGLSGVFFDDSDLRLDGTFRNQLNELVNPLVEQLYGQHSSIALDKISEVPGVPPDLLTRYAKIRDARSLARWNKKAMGFGLAMRLKSPSGKIEDAKDDGAAAWLNLAYPGIGIFEENSQFLFAAAYRHDDYFERDGVTGREDSFNLGAQWRAGTANFHGYAEAFYHWRRPEVGARTSELTFELGIEQRLFESLWFNLAWSNDDSLTGGNTIKSGLRYGFGKAASLDGK